MTSQTGQQIITIHILPNISSRKDNQAMKFSQLSKYRVRNIFFKSHAENKVEDQFQTSFYFQEKFDVR